MAAAKRKESRQQLEEGSPAPPAVGAGGPLDRLFGLSAASFSIATGIRLGFIAYVALKVLVGHFNEINAAVAVIAAAYCSS